MFLFQRKKKTEKTTSRLFSLHKRAHFVYFSSALCYGSSIISLHNLILHFHLIKAFFLNSQYSKPRPLNSLTVASQNRKSSILNANGY